ncbi:DUF5999 family protein [Streptomyces sp. NPDC058290]|uniref:DUF5999 family protein n=1 Tax=Streptomyces sp. NPDC058290 TaxID=3346426 RepID=UPI0036ECB350
MCNHPPPSPTAAEPDHDAARTVSAHPEQGRSLQYNGVLVLEDGGELFPDGRIITPVAKVRAVSA